MEKMDIFVKCLKFFYLYFEDEVDMSYIAPQMKEKFETLSANLKNDILKRDVQINTMQDLIRVLEEIVAEGEK